MTSRELWYVKVFQGVDESDAHAYHYILDCVRMPGGELESITACAKVLEVMCDDRNRLSFEVPPPYIKVVVQKTEGDDKRRDLATMIAQRDGERYRDPVGKPIGLADENVKLHRVDSRY